MNFTITGKNMELTDGLKQAVESKLGKLSKYFRSDTEATVTLSIERELQKAEVTIPIKGNILRAEQATTDMYTSIELAGDTIEKQLLKHRKKLIEKHHNVEGFSEVYLEEEADEDDEILIVRKKSFAVKPMDPEEACLQMDMLGHNFYVFRNADTDDICVVYKRKNNTYGLIEPEN